MTFNSGRLSSLDQQKKYVIEIYSSGAACPVCAKIQTPWEACGLDAETWYTTQKPEYVCIECGTTLRHDVYLMGGWGWGNPAAPKPHR